MKKFTVTYEFASYISEEIESADMDEACEILTTKLMKPQHSIN